jgi:uncharacterized protein YuzE
MAGLPVRLTYDPGADAAYIYLVDVIGPGEVEQTRSAMVDLHNAFIALDFGQGGRLIGIEVLGASKVLPEETLRAAGDP